MASPGVIRYPLPDDVPPGAVLAGIESRCDVRVGRARRTRTRYLDTFDWRIHRGGWELSWQDGAYRLATAGDGARVDGCSGTGGERFWWDFAAGSFRDRMRGCLDVRALLPLCEIDMNARPVAIVNADEKTVVRGRIEDAVLGDERARGKGLRSFVALPVRGYDREFAEVCGYLDELGLLPAAGSIVDNCVRLSGRVPGDYSSKLDFSLHPDMPARMVAGLIFRHLFETMRRNEPGIIDDIDTEFVHDFRVAVRRTRAALSELKGVFPAAVTARFKGDFARVGRITNRLRDLDVHLLERDRYRAMVPDDLRPALEDVFMAMERRRAAELERVRDELLGDDYRGVVSAWEDTLASLDGQGPALGADKPVLPLARRAIYKRFRRVVRDGGATAATSPDEDLHALRIECKKLRYLLEFFASLFPDEVEGLVRQLKRLQDNLGAFNDYAVFQDDLRSYLGDDTTPRVASAVGGLIGGLYAGQRGARGELSSRFEEFASAGNVSAFLRLFAPEGS